MPPRSPAEPVPADRPPGDAVVIRTAEPGEYAELGRLTVRAYRSAGYLGADDPYLETLGDPAGRSAGCELIVAARPDGRLVGGVALVHPESPQREVAGPDEAEIRMLAVAPDQQRRGLGQRLTMACLERADAGDYAAVMLCVIAGNDAAHRLYRGLGFERAPERDWRPAPAVELLAYRRRLRPGR